MASAAWMKASVVRSAVSASKIPVAPRLSASAFGGSSGNAK